MNVRHLLIETHPHLAPAATLAGLSPADATRRLAHAPHSIAEIVAHMTYWQAWFTARCEGRDEPMAPTAAIGWPAASHADWPALAERFVAGLELLAQAVSPHDLEALVSPAVGAPMMAAYSYRDVCEHVALHNAHHLGQVILLRQMMGVWPPPAGSYTW
jgi:uncharacterized damage-inducible protein DinB